MLNAEHYQFARQCGCTHVVVHLVDYFARSAANRRDDQPIGDNSGWGYAGDPEKLWTYEYLAALRAEINAAGLELAAIENFDPAHWFDVLLDGPKKQVQLENIKTMIRNMGRAGIPVMGYNFSLAGVAGRITGPFARGGAEAVGMEGIDERPIPEGMVWNMVYDPNATGGPIPAATHAQLWSRLQDFLEAIVPVAEEAGVTLAAHPDDPPVPMLRGQPRLVYQPDMYQRLIDLKPSSRNQLEFCLGSVAEMTEGDVHQAVEQYSGQNKIAYIHFRNVHGKVPHYREVFVDEGDIDMRRVIAILRKNKFEGVLIPDHAPKLTCAAPWHASMAYALGYIRALLGPDAG